MPYRNQDLDPMDAAKAHQEDAADREYQRQKHGECKWCGRVNEGNPSDYYHRSRCEADSIREALKEVTCPEEKAHLERRLESALYVGD
jgi:hypothetical protein